MSEIKISIIIPIFNAAKYLSRCLDSILNQDYKNLEIICINDGSTDESLTILHIYEKKDKRLKIISQFNQGAAAARNRGLKAATGEYISFIDADDYLEEGLYKYFTEAVQKDLVDIFMFNGKINNKPSSSFFSKHNFYCPVEECQNVSYKDFFGIFYGNSGVYNKIFSRNFIEKNRLYFLEGNSFEDIDFWFRSLILTDKIKVSFKSFYHYQQENENSVTNSFGKNALSIFDTFSSMMKAAKKQGLDDFFQDALFQYQYEKITETLFIMKPEYKEKLYNKAKEFLTRRIKELKGYSYKNLMNFGICHNLLTNSFVDFKNTTLLFRENFNYCTEKPKNIKFSVIIPVYNIEAYLGTCLKSIINQTLTDLEIICINDGSTDKSLDILNFHAAQDVRIKIINQENKGLGAARNIGVSQAQGEYLIFVDSDDWLRTDALEQLNKQMQENPTDVCFFGYSNFFDEGKYNIPIPFLNNLLENKFNNIFDYMFVNITAWGKIYSREFWQKNKIAFAENVFFEDNITNAQVFSFAKTCSICWHNLYYYRIRANSITQTVYSDKKIKDLFDALDAVYDFIIRQNFYEQIKPAFQKFAKNCLKAHFAKIPKEKQQDFLLKEENLVTKVSHSIY